MTLNDRVKILINTLNQNAIVSNGNSMYFDGATAFILIKQFADDVAIEADSNARSEVDKNQSYDESVAEAYRDSKRKAGRPKGNDANS